MMGLPGIQEMSNKSGDLYEFNFDVDPDRIKIRLNIQVIIIRSTTIYPEDNLVATIQSSKIAWSNEDKIIFEREDPSGGFIDCRWEDFETSGSIPMNAKDGEYYLKLDGKNQ